MIRTRFTLLLMISLWACSGPALAAGDLTDLLVKKGTITKEEAEALQKREVASSADKITFYGDFRLRQETQWLDGDGNDSLNVNRQRFRLRIGSDIQHRDFLLHLRLASGTGDQASTNQSFGGLSSQKSFWIDRAYLEFLRVPHTSFMAGRMANPFFANLTGDLVWDDDVNPEGFAERFAVRPGRDREWFATAAQIILDGGGSSADGQWLLGYQVGGQARMEPLGLNFALAYYSLANGQRSSFSQKSEQDGNTRVSGIDPTLVNPYRLIHGTAAVSLAPGVPVLVSVDLVKNLADTFQGSGIEDENMGYALGLRLGKASGAGGMELGYVYRLLETDATIADLSDSDFGPKGGTNRKGHAVWTAYNPTASTQLKLRYVRSRIENDALPPAPISGVESNPTHHRVQVDFSFKF